MSRKLKLPPAQAPCSECLSNAKETAKFIVAACSHNQAVALMPIKDGKPEGIWRIYTPAKPGDLIGPLGQK